MAVDTRGIMIESKACMKAGILVAATLLLSACAGVLGGIGSPEVEVGERAKARYAALVARDYETVYRFFTPGFRQSWGYREYMSARPPIAVHTSAELVSVKCDTQEVCELGVNVTYIPSTDVRGVPKGAEVSRLNEEKWIRVNGEWWFYQTD